MKEYNNDKDVVFALMKRVDYNKSWEEIDHDLGYDMGDYNFGKGDNRQLREKIVDTIRQIRLHLIGVFDDEGNTSRSTPR
jgi:hypothetical protein